MDGSPSSSQELVDGLNFRVIQGKQKKSRVIVQDNYCYTVERTDTLKNGQGTVFYLRCKYSQTCPGRAVIKGNLLEVSNQDRLHECSATEGASLSKIASQELLTTMKKRAAQEGTTFFVSVKQL